MEKEAFGFVVRAPGKGPSDEEVSRLVGLHRLGELHFQMLERLLVGGRYQLESTEWLT